MRRLTNSVREPFLTMLDFKKRPGEWGRLDAFRTFYWKNLTIQSSLIRLKQLTRSSGLSMRIVMTTTPKAEFCPHCCTLEQLAEFLPRAEAHYIDKKTRVTIPTAPKSVPIEILIDRFKMIEEQQKSRLVSLNTITAFRYVDRCLAALDQKGRTDHKRVNILLRLFTPINPPYQRITVDVCYG